MVANRRGPEASTRSSCNVHAKELTTNTEVVCTRARYKPDTHRLMEALPKQKRRNAPLCGAGLLSKAAGTCVVAMANLLDRSEHAQPPHG
eukprot:3589589-Prymnesium_polylepis.1